MLFRLIFTIIGIIILGVITIIDVEQKRDLPIASKAARGPERRGTNVGGGGTIATLDVKCARVVISLRRCVLLQLR